MRFIRSDNHQLPAWRINALELGIFFLIFLIVGRLFYLQVFEHDYYVLAGQNQRMVDQEIEPERGRIYALSSYKNANNLYPLAVNQVYYEVIADPSSITRPQNITDIVASIFEMEEEQKDEILQKLKKENSQYQVLAKDVPQEKIDQLERKLEELRVDINKEKPEEEQLKTFREVGVRFQKHVLRLYPDNQVGAHILGFLGYDEEGYNREGKYGLEGYFENELAGFKGRVLGEKDISGRLLSGDYGREVENGSDIVLTIDHSVQYATCKALERSVVRHGAKSGTVIVMETKNGSIRAMSNYPSFDPNNYNEVETTDVYNNLAVYDSYEPGSVMKSIAMAIAIDQGKVTPNSIYEDEGEIKFAGGQTIRNSDLKAHGMVDMKEVLASSLNTGIIYATHEVNNKIFEDYMKKFGFGESSNIKISQEAVGNISSLAKKGDIYKATASYGQGITVTPLQMVSAINAIANGGQLVQPQLVKEIRHLDGSAEIFEPQIIRQVVEKSTAAQISAMMVHVVDSGHAIKAAVDGYYVAGKTGTAQVANPETGRYYTDRTIHNFIGFAPNDDPKFTMITKLDYPTSASFSSDTAAPLFGEIAKFLLEYYQIAPNR